MNGQRSVTGVTPASLNTPVLIHANLTRLEVVSDMHARKARMSALADAFIALPGGFGTLEELFEILTWAQIGLHRKPVGLLNVRHYFDPLIALVEHAQSEGFLYAEHRHLIIQSDDPDRLLAALEEYVPPAGLDRWLQRD